MQEQETITISKAKYDKLIIAYKKLRALEAGGVDNWEGYDATMEMLEEE